MTDAERGALTEDRVQLMIQSAVAKALLAHEQHLMAHMDQQFAALRQTFADAFPNGDPHGHRMAHDKAIANAGWWAGIKADAFTKTITASLWVTMTFVAMAVWEHFKEEVKK